MVAGEGGGKNFFNQIFPKAKSVDHVYAQSITRTQKGTRMYSIVSCVYTWFFTATCLNATSPPRPRPPPPPPPAALMTASLSSRQRCGCPHPPPRYTVTVRSGDSAAAAAEETLFISLFFFSACTQVFFPVMTVVVPNVLFLFSLCHSLMDFPSPRYSRAIYSK